MRATVEGGDRRADGYSLVAVLMILTVLNVMIAAALPLASHAARREKEEELIFRGLQYAEAIRVFQRRHGRAPARLEELIEVEPRSIRQLWEDPLSDGGAWGLLVQGAPAATRDGGAGDRQRPPRGRQQRDPRGNQSPDTDEPLVSDGPGVLGVQPASTAVVAVPPTRQPDGTMRSLVAGGQIIGVFPAASEETPIRTFFAADSYEQWQFLVSLLPVPAAPTGDGPLPRSNAAWIGRPFREGLQPQLPGAGEPAAGGQPGQDLTPPAGGRQRGRRPGRS